jgi:uncharacterized membrane protein YdjX (TVP38/TMEM64 family)
MYGVLATTGSLIGAGITFWIGRKVGEHGLTRLVKSSTLRRVEERVKHRGALSIAALGIIPPPFPFTAFVLTSAAWHVSPWTFLTMLAGVRLLRCTGEAGLAAYHGGGIVAWMESSTFTGIVTGLAVLAVTGTLISGIALVRSIRSRPLKDGP